MISDNPTSLEEAFALVRQKPLEKAVYASSNPFDRFMLDLAKVVKQEKKTFVPRNIETFAEDLAEDLADQILEEEEQSYRYAPAYVDEAMHKLTNALQKARVEAHYRLQEAAAQEEAELLEEEILEEVQPPKPLLATSLEGVLNRLAETLQKANQPEEPEEEKDNDDRISTDEAKPEKKSYVPTANQNNPYVNELIRTTKNEPKIFKGSKKKADLKKIIAEQISAELESFRRQLFSSNLMMGGGGGGTNAVQYAAGGTMNGDLNVTGRILSGGVDISEAIKRAVNAIVVDLPAPRLIDSGSY